MREVSVESAVVGVGGARCAAPIAAACTIWAARASVEQRDVNRAMQRAPLACGCPKTA